MATTSAQREMHARGPMEAGGPRGHAAHAGAGRTRPQVVAHGAVSVVHRSANGPGAGDTRPAQAGVGDPAAAAAGRPSWESPGRAVHFAKRTLGF